jgi:6-pyruvoyltetrahydropterin/6-carboxytetrahydropterin synthase
MPGRFEVSYETHFCSAHALRDYKGTTEPTHGHNFRVIVTVSGSKIDRAGMLVDFLDLKASVDAEVERFNYGFVNEKVPEFADGKLSPSAENMAYVIFQNVKKQMPRSVKVDSVQLFESPGCAATYRE